MAPRLRRPPDGQSFDGRDRHVGVEIEFGGVPCLQVARHIRDLYGGRLEEVTRHSCLVHDTRLGSFTVKLDWSAAHLADAEAGRDDLGAWLKGGLQELLGELGSLVMPYEVAAPPILLAELASLDRLLAILRAAGAYDTRVDWLHAFALQLNPEAPSLAADAILRLFRAYLLLSDWLRQQIEVDVTRRLLSMVDRFPEDYVRRVVAPDYQPSREQLIDDYLEANPTRNRELDLLPLFAYLDEARVRRRLDDPRIRPRPAYHYRLPDCRLTDPAWSVVTEWNRWVEVEYLAADPDRLRSLAERFLAHDATAEPPWAEVAAPPAAAAGPR